METSMKVCQVQSRPDRSVGKHVACGKPAKFIANYKETDRYPAHMTYMCADHAQMAKEVQEVEFKP